MTETVETSYALLVTNPQLINLDVEAGSVAQAPSRTGLIDALMPGYSKGDGKSKDAARFFYLVAAANQATGVLTGAAVNSGELNLEDLEQHTLDALLNTSRENAVLWGEWDLDVPLIILPQLYNGQPRPTGNIIELDGTNESTFLESLERLGAIEVLVRD